MNPTLSNGMSKKALWMGLPYVQSTVIIGLRPVKMTLLALKTGLMILITRLMSTAVQQRQSVVHLAR